LGLQLLRAVRSGLSAFGLVGRERISGLPFGGVLVGSRLRGEAGELWRGERVRVSAAGSG